MNNPILTTRKTSTEKFIGDLISAVIFVIIGLWFSWPFLLLALIDFLYHWMQFNTYADVYQDRIIGKGMQKIAQQSFDLRFDQIVDMSQSKGFLNLGSGNGVFLVINTAGGSYQIVTKPDRANEIMEFYRKKKL